MSGPYLIQLDVDSHYGLGVTAPENGANVILSEVEMHGDDRTQWGMDDTSGLIYLFLHWNLVLDVNENYQDSGTPLVLRTFVHGRAQQKWDWRSRPGYIINRAYPSMCLDNYRDIRESGNQQVLWQCQQGDPAEYWDINPAFGFFEAAKREAAQVGASAARAGV